MQTPKQQMYVAIAFLLGALLGGTYVYVYEPGHGHESEQESFSPQG